MVAALAGGAPASVPRMIFLLFGQMMPQTLNSITMPKPPPTPMESTWIVVSADRRVIHKQPTRGVNQNGSDHAEDVSARTHLLDHEKENRTRRTIQSSKKNPMVLPRAAALALRVGSD